jgi:hypothetical protein
VEVAADEHAAQVQLLGRSVEQVRRRAGTWNLRTTCRTFPL